MSSDIVYPNLPRLKSGQKVNTPVGTRIVAWQTNDIVTVIDKTSTDVDGIKTRYVYRDFKRREVTLVP